MSRRAALRLLAGLPLAAAAAPAVEAGDYASEDEVFAALDALAVEVDARAAAIGRAVPAAAGFAASLRGDLARHRRERAELGATATPAPAPTSLEEPTDLARLRGALADLMYAHAEGLVALRRGRAVQHLADHMVDLSRLLTVVDLWLESEAGHE